jgi:hypothetical protein
LIAIPRIICYTPPFGPTSYAGTKAEEEDRVATPKEKPNTVETVARRRNRIAEVATEYGLDPAKLTQEVERQLGQKVAEAVVKDLTRGDERLSW